MDPRVKQQFNFDFGVEKIAFANLMLGEIKGLGAVLKTFNQANQNTLDAFADIMPFVVSAAQRVNKEVTQEKLEQLIDLFNLMPLIEQLIANSYAVSTSPDGKVSGEKYPVQ